MSTALPSRWLFWGPTLIWASTWHVILYQLDSGVPVFNSVAWRFGLAALLLAALARGQARCRAVDPRSIVPPGGQPDLPVFSD